MPPAVFLWRVGASDGRPALDLGELQPKWRWVQLFWRDF